MTISCKNCNHKYKGQFCHNCGQKAATHEIDFRFIAHEVPHSAFHVDKGILFTIKQLTINPGKAINDYIKGKRINHFPPLTYMILVTTVYVLINRFQIYFEFREATPSLEFQRNHRLAFFLSIIPLYALIYWIFHKKFGYNYWQYLVAQTYIMGHYVLMISIPNIFLFTFPETRTNLKIYYVSITFLYFIYAYYSIHKDLFKNKWKLLLLEIICFLVASIVSLFTSTTIFEMISNYLK